MRNVTAVLAVLGLAACATEGPGVAPPAPWDVMQSWPTKAEDVQLTVGKRTFGASILAPTDPGPWPAVLLFAGSGPSDRDWNNKLLPGDNGSGKLLADALASHGVVVIRWDKAGTGWNPGPPPAEYSLDTDADEAKVALDLVRARPDVRPDAIFFAAHSEGSIAATRLAAKVGDQVRGVMFLSSPGRSMKAVLMEQLAIQFRDEAHLPPDQVDAQLKPISQAFDDFIAGKPVDVAHASRVPTVRKLLAALTRPETASIARAMFALEPAKEAAALPQHDFLVVGGGKDVQFDPTADAGAIRDALAHAGKHVTYFVAPDMDHVLKHEPRSKAEVAKDLQVTQDNYNAIGRTLEPSLVVAMLQFIAAASIPGADE